MELTEETKTSTQLDEVKEPLGAREVQGQMPGRSMVHGHRLRSLAELRQGNPPLLLENRGKLEMMRRD